MAMTGNPLLALLATGGSFIGSTANAVYQYVGAEKNARSTRRAIEEQGKYNMRLVNAYRNFEKAKEGAEGGEAGARLYSLRLKTLQDEMARYSAKYGEEAAMKLYEGSSGTASSDAKATVVNNNVTNNNSVTQNNTIGAEFSQIGNLINQKLVDLMERNLSFDTSMVMEVAGA